MKMSPKDFFLYLGVTVTLYWSVGSFLSLLFEYINTLFPSDLDFFNDPFSPQIRFAIASLIVVFPIYIILSKLINKDITNIPEKKDLPVRKWLIFLTLFIAGIAVIVDLITLVNTFLGGDLTARFILKVIVVFGVVGGAFMYYLHDLKGNITNRKMIGWAVSIIVILSLVSSFLIIGSPKEVRDLRFDQEKVNDLSMIQNQIIQYWQTKDSLPLELSALNDSVIGFTVPTDAQTGEDYEYQVLEKYTFNLCAVFNEEGDSQYRYKDDSWKHEAGKVCFERTIDPDRFKFRLNEEIRP